MNICLYGASSNEIDKTYIEMTEKLGEAIGEAGHSLVYGGGANGLMGAAARGVVKKGGKVIGVAPSFFNVDGVLFEDCAEFIYTETMRERKQIMEHRADAFVAVPGGIGTFDEFFEIMTLKQLGQHNKPIAIYNINGYYDNLIEMLNTAVKQGFMTEKSKELVPAFDNPKELIEYFQNYKPEEHEFSVLKKVDFK
ncbi:MAG: TIGR00730 family Rossman fold protein [Clostridia bacterium]|nr:TIGR00730 family Rossman fold protein [Clostridia bacterium]